MSDKKHLDYVSQFSGDEIDKEVKYVQTTVRQKLPKIEQELSNKINEKLAVKISDKNKPGGYAGLDANGKISSGLLPEPYNPNPSDPSEPIVTDNTFVIRFDSSNAGDKSYSDILNAMENNKTIIGMSAKSTSKSFYFSYIQYSFAKVRLVSLAGADRCHMFDCLNPEYNDGTNSWIYQLIKLHTLDDFDAFEVELNERLDKLEEDIENAGSGEINLDGYATEAYVQQYMNEALLGGKW
jgi:hypothetical protein